MSSAMNVGELRKVLEGVPDDLPILMPGHDHSYTPYCRFTVGTARYVKAENYYCEDSGDDADHRPEEKVIQALLGYS